MRGFLCGERARRVCGDLPKARLRVGKGALSLAEIPPPGVPAYLTTGM